MFATQSRFWNNRIVITAGGRIDALQFDMMNGARMPASDARVVSREILRGLPPLTPVAPGV
jgi:hypothetical protein